MHENVKRDGEHVEFVWNYIIRCSNNNVNFFLIPWYIIVEVRNQSGDSKLVQTAAINYKNLWNSRK